MEKQCICCKKTKDISEFYKHPKMADGHLNQCKGCKKEYQRKLQATPEGRERDRRRYRSEKRQDWFKKWTPIYRVKNRERINKRKNEWAKMNIDRLRKARAQAEKRYLSDPIMKEKIYARRKLRWHVKQGNVKQSDCVVCGKIAQAHHNDYKKPLDVVWYCREHHSTFHYLLRLITT